MKNKLREILLKVERYSRVPEVKESLTKLTLGEQFYIQINERTQRQLVMSIYKYIKR